MTRPHPTLALVFVAANVSLAALLGALVYGLSRASERSVLATSELVRRATSAVIGARVHAHLDTGERIIGSVERQIRLGVCNPRDPKSVEATLFAVALDWPGLAGISLTQGRSLGFDEEGRMQLAPEGREQMSVYRDGLADDSALRTTWVRGEGGRFVEHERHRPAGGGLLASPFVSAAASAVGDPTRDLTFVTPASRPNVDGQRPIWSDLSYAEADVALPEPEKRVVLSAMRAVKDAEGRFVGVVRISLRTETIDRIVWEEQERFRPNQIVLCDDEGKLVARLAPGDPVIELPDTSLRIAPTRPPEEIVRALADDSLARVGPEHVDASGRFLLGGRPYLVSFRALPETQGWRVGIVVAEADVPGVAEQSQMRRRLLAFVALLSAAILAGGFFTLRTVRRGLAGVAASAGRMRAFDFAASEARSFFRDVEDVMASLELAKTAMRAMGKYVPVDLVKTLYRTGEEPRLGGELQPVTLLFTDIKGFTALSERLPPNELARVLGRYLEVMSAAIQDSGGTIDKYIGDAIMAVWNAPTPCPDHPRRACEAALAAQAAGAALFASPEWEGRPALITRFGLHTDEVLVGHFGAPDRLSYTCLGDGVNLASRLEGLNKQYGTTLLVSDAVRQVAGSSFAFRFLDMVAVSGKGMAVKVHELLGPAGAVDARVATALRYEEALALYLRREFRKALSLFEALAGDPPSAVLAERCRVYATAPPPDDWDGTYTAMSK